MRAGNYDHGYMVDDLPALFRDGAFLYREARACGISERRLQSGDLTRPHRGVRNPRAATTLVDRCAALLPALPEGVAFSHITALGLWGLPLPLRETDAPLHVVSPLGHHPRRPGVVAHRVQALAGTFLRGIPVVGPLAAWAQCADQLTPDELVAVGDALAGRWSPEAAARERPLAELEREVEARGSRRGTRRLREALDLIRPNVWSPKETELRLLLVRAGLPEPPALNQEFRAYDGTRLGCADLAYPRQKLALEYEGDHHRTDQRQWRRDIARRERFADAGWRQIRVTDADLKERRILVSRIARHLGCEAPL